DGALRTASQLNNLVHRHRFVTALQKQIGCDFLELAVSDFATRTLFSHCSPPTESIDRSIGNGTSPNSQTSNRLVQAAELLSHALVRLHPYNVLYITVQNAS